MRWLQSGWTKIERWEAAEAEREEDERGSSNATVDGVTEWSGLTERERGKSGRVSQSHSDGEKRQQRGAQSNAK